MTRWEKSLEKNGWNALFIENHDKPRIVSTWGNDKEYWRDCATAFATVYMLMMGTAFIYQGKLPIDTTVLTRVLSRGRISRPRDRHDQRSISVYSRLSGCCSEEFLQSRVSQRHRTQRNHADHLHHWP